MCWRMSTSSPAAQLDRGWGLHWEVLESQRGSRVALCHRPDQDPAYPPRVPGWQLKDLQDNSGDFLQVQALLQTAQRLRTQRSKCPRQQPEERPEEHWTPRRVRQLNSM